MTSAPKLEIATEASHPFLGRTLARCIEDGRDNFLILRVLAASLVIFGHSWATANNPTKATDWIGQQTLVFSGTVAVDMFFWISGFLVTMSYARRHAPIDFALARILRIFPGLIANVLFCVLVVGAVATTLPLSEYFVHPQLKHFIVGNVLLNDLQWTLPGVFEGNANKGVVNGCLWTLPGEIRMYEIVLAVGILGLLRNAWRFGLALAVLIATALYVPQIPLLQQAEFVEFAAFFAFGAFCYFHRASIPVSGYLVLALAFLALCLRGSPGYPLAFSAFVAYATLWFAYAPRLPSFERFGDYSYGLYLYGFPMQQLVALWFPAWGPWKALVLSFPLALALAIVSWHAIEKPILRLKPRRSAGRTIDSVDASTLRSSGS